MLRVALCFCLAAVFVDAAAEKVGMVLVTGKETPGSSPYSAMISELEMSAKFNAGIALSVRAVDANDIDSQFNKLKAEGFKVN